MRDVMNAALPELIPVRMLNEFAFCPRLAHLEWVQGEFEDNVATFTGRFDHRRVDRPGPVKRYDSLKQTLDQQADLIHGNAIKLSAPAAGLVGVIDVVEGDGMDAVPVDYKHGPEPRIAGGVWPSDRVQLCAQALMLREQGYQCDHGVVYYAGSKSRVDVFFDDQLISDTWETIQALRSMAASGEIPPPLAGSSKCPGCSLVTVCLPDEVNVCAHEQDGMEHPLRRLIPARKDQMPLYVHTQGAKVGKKGENLVVTARDMPAVAVRLLDISQVSVFGGVQVTTPAVNCLCGHRIPLCYFSHGGWFYGVTKGLGHKNVELRIYQYRAVDDDLSALNLSRRLVDAKIRNCRTFLRRNMIKKDEKVLRELNGIILRLPTVDNKETLLGLEGTAARLYFGAFPGMFKQPGDQPAFEFENRNRRPPKDPVNALLSFAYSMLTKDMTVTLQTVGFDPYLGFYHATKYGRPALALDLIEEFRPIIADSTVINVINNGIITPKDFVQAGGGINLTVDGRKKFTQTYERRLDQMITHPVFKYRITYRQVFDIQVRLLGRHLAGELPDYPMFLVR